MQQKGHLLGRGLWLMGAGMLHVLHTMAAAVMDKAQADPAELEPSASGERMHGLQVGRCSVEAAATCLPPCGRDIFIYEKPLFSL